MKILMVNKFLYPNGGSETYMFRLGEYFQKEGHEVQYFGMEHPERCVGNRISSYTSNMNFHEGSLLGKLFYPIKTIYSFEARRKLRRVLDDFLPEIVHLNNFNYQLTPSIILEIVRWKKQTGHKCRMIYTAHDYQLVCPNHMMNNPATKENCDKCLGGHFINCARGKCIHGSTLRSIIGMAESYFWSWKKVYRHIDKIICCSAFLKQKLDTNPLLAAKTEILHNFVNKVYADDVQKKDYVLYFGRFAQEKGIETLLKVCGELKDIPFIFAGVGPLESKITGFPNVQNKGFLQGTDLEKLICEARFSVYPSEWYENCPFSVMESQMYGTPVLGADIGGIPELIKVGVTGELFHAGNSRELTEKIRELWDNWEKVEIYSCNCRRISFDSLPEYAEKLLKIYQENGGEH